MKERNKGKESLDKYGNISEGQKQIYKEELTKFNNILDEEEEQYLNIIDNYSNGYKNKINCIMTNITLFKSYGKIFMEKFKELLTNIERSIPIINIKNDVEYFKQDNNYLNENKRRFFRL